MDFCTLEDVARFHVEGDDPTPIRAKALYAYDAQKSDELSLSQDDCVMVLRKGTDGWSRGIIEGSLGSGISYGYFPTSYIEFLDGSSNGATAGAAAAAPARPSKGPPAAAASGAKRVKALYAYQDPETGHSCQAGMEMDVVNDALPEWILVRVPDGREFYAPRTYCEAIVQAPVVKQVPTPTVSAPGPVKTDLPKFSKPAAAAPSHAPGPSVSSKPVKAKPLSKKPVTRPPPAPAAKKKPPLARSSLIQPGNAANPVEVERLRTQLGDILEECAQQQAANSEAEQELEALLADVGLRQQEVDQLEADAGHAADTAAKQADLEVARQQLEALREACTAMAGILQRHGNVSI